MNPKGTVQPQWRVHFTIHFPHVKHFHGSIMFIDICGFTSLSTKVTPEVMKNIIKEYFSQISRSGVSKFGGDVVELVVAVVAVVVVVVVVVV